MSKQLGILFKPEMVRAILEGRKTQTRRGVKAVVGEDPFVDMVDYDRDKGCMTNLCLGWRREDGSLFGLRCPWQVGDYLYVKEAWWSYGYFEETGETTKSGKAKKRWIQAHSRIEFAADHDDDYIPAFKASNGKNVKWRKMSSLFLAQKDARIWLKVTNVSVERLLDISEADAIAEGIISHKGVPGEYPSETMYKDYLGTGCVISPIHSYFTLWDSINGAGSHKESGWVWVIEFERSEKP